MTRGVIFSRSTRQCFHSSCDADFIRGWVHANARRD